MNDRATLDTLERMATEIRDLRSRVRSLEGQERIASAQGTFVPTLVGSGTAGSFTYVPNVNLVEWTRFGNRLLFNGRLSISAIAVAPVGNMSINGWPFAGVANANMAIAGGATMIAWQTNLATAHTQVEGQFGNSSSMVLVKSGDNLGLGAVQGGDIALVAGVVEFRFEGQYRIA